MTAPARTRITATDLAMLMVRLDDTQNWSPAAALIAEQARAAADQILHADGWLADEERIDHAEPGDEGRELPANVAGFSPSRRCTTPRCALRSGHDPDCIRWVPIPGYEGQQDMPHAWRAVTIHTERRAA